MTQIPDEEQDWYFTFGCGQEHAGCYTVIRGTHDSAKGEMYRRYGGKWSMQYSSAEAAGVNEWGLKKIDRKKSLALGKRKQCPSHRLPVWRS